MRGYYHVCYVLFVCGFTYNSRIVNSYGDVECKHYRIVNCHVTWRNLGNEKKGHADFVILGLQTG